MLVERVGRRGRVLEELVLNDCTLTNGTSECPVALEDVPRRSDPVFEVACRKDRLLLTDQPIDRGVSSSRTVLVKRIPPDGEGLQPCFSGRWIDVTKTITEQRGKLFYLPKDTFYRVPISVTFESKSEPSSLQCSR